MLAVHEVEKPEPKKVSIRYDDSTRTYYCFYHKTDDLSSELILSYTLDEDKWTVDTLEYKHIFERYFNELFMEKNIPFEEQIRYVINYLNIYFADRSQEQKMKINAINHHAYSFGWLRRLRGIRRWVSHDILTEPSPVLQRYSAPERSTPRDQNDQIMSVKTLAECFYNNDLDRFRSKTSTHSNEIVPIQLDNKAPPITEIWLNVITQGMGDFRKKIGNRIGEEKLKKLAEKFVTYFSGTFQCNVGHQYQLEYDCQTWYFTILKVELMKSKTHSETTKFPKTKIIFLIDGIPHYVRG